MKQGTFLLGDQLDLRLDRPPPRGATHLRLERNGRRVDRAGLVSAVGFSHRRISRCSRILFEEKTAMTVNPIGSILALVLTLGVSAPLRRRGAAGGEKPFSPRRGPPSALRQGLRDLGYRRRTEPHHRLAVPTGPDNRLSLCRRAGPSQAGRHCRRCHGRRPRAMQATSTIPIVMASSADAVGSGLVSNLGRPGRNVTGVTIHAGGSEHEASTQPQDAVPNVTRVAVLWIQLFHGTRPC